MFHEWRMWYGYTERTIFKPQCPPLMGSIYLYMYPAIFFLFDQISNEWIHQSCQSFTVREKQSMKHKYTGLRRWRVITSEYLPINTLGAPYSLSTFTLGVSFNNVLIYVSSLVLIPASRWFSSGVIRWCVHVIRYVLKPKWRYIIIYILRIHKWIVFVGHGLSVYVLLDLL